MYRLIRTLHKNKVSYQSIRECGLLAYFMFGRLDSKNIHDRTSTMDKALKTLHHRGPENRGLWFSDNQRVGLGHVRLSIIDLSSAGDQPLFNENKSIALVVNGELYGYEALRNNLITLGHIFKSHSDSEVLLYLYAEYGLRCFEHMRGEFAFSLYDSNKNTFIAGRDRFGIKPLYYAVHNNQLVVGSEIKALFASGVPAVWNQETFVSGGFSFNSHHSIFKGIHQVPPGHYLIATPNGNIDIVRYFDMNNYPDRNDGPEKDGRSDNEMISQVREKLIESIDLRMHADVPVSVYLSGGLDSCSILGIASKVVTQRKIDAYTISFVDDPKFDEFHIAQRMSNFCNTNHHKLEVSAKDIALNFESCLYHTETLMASGNGVAKYLLSRLVNSHGKKVVLTGEGSDEIFCGYPFFKQDFLLRYSSEQQHEEIKKLAGKHLLGLPSPSTTETSHDIRRILSYFPTFMKLMGEQNDFSTFFHESEKQQVVCNYNPLSYFIAQQHGQAVHNMYHKWDPVHSSMYLWCKSFLLNNLLVVLGDRCEMAHSVEGRVPFLDHELVELVNGMPLHIKLRDMQEKYILREAVKPYITPELYDRQKHPFMAPTASISKQNNEMIDLIQSTLRSDHMKDVSFMDHAKVIKLLDSIYSNMSTNSQLDIPRKLKMDATLNQLLSIALLQKLFNPKTM